MSTRTSLLAAAASSAALVAAGVTEDFREGAEKAEQAIVSGAAAVKLEALRQFGRD